MKWLSAIVIFSFGLTSESGQQHPRGFIQGTVLSREDSRVLVGANVGVQGTVVGTTTDANGRFIIRDIPPGTYTISVSLLGFERKVLENVNVGPGQLTSLRIELEPAAIQIEPVVVTAGKREQGLQEIPVSVSVIDNQALSARNTVTIDDALRYVPGVNITSTQVNIRGSSGYSLGVGTRTLLLVDGMPFLTGDTGEIIWESLPMNLVDRVEIVKGAASALYGSSALGGVINVITKSARDLPETMVRMYGGAYEAPAYSEWEWTTKPRLFNGMYINHSRRVGDLSILVAGSRTENNSYIQNDDWKRWNFYARLGYDLSPFQSMTLAFGVLDQHRGNFLFWKDLNHALEPPDDQLTERVNSRRWSLAGSYKRFLSDKFFTIARINWFHATWVNNIPNTYISTGDSSQSDVVNAEFQAGFQPGEKQILTFGFTGTFNNVAQSTIFGRHSGYDVAAYAQDDLKIHPQVTATVGARMDAQKLEGVTSVGQFNPKLGVVFTPGGQSTLRLSIGRGFRAPSIAEMFTTTEASGVTILPNPNLLPERSWSYEVGGARTFSENLFAEVSLFRNEFWDLIEPTFDVDGNVHFENVVRARIQGTEIHFTSNWFSRLLFAEVSYTYIYPEDVTHHDVLKYRPRHLWYTSVRLVRDPFQLGCDFRFLSRVERIDDEFVTLGIIKQGDERVPIYVTDVRLTADWRFVELPVTSTFHINNIFNYYYVELIGNIAPVRNYVLTLEASL